MVSELTQEAPGGRPVADLLVVLQKIDEGGRWQPRARLAARLAVAMRGRLALIRKAGRKRPHDAVQRRLRVIAVIAVGLARQQHVPGVMVVVVPLGAIASARRSRAGIEQARVVVVVLEHEMNGAAGRGVLSSFSGTR